MDATFSGVENSAPIAVDDYATTNEETSITVDVLANDYDLDGGTLTITSVETSSSGTVVHNGDGTIIYTPGTDYAGNRWLTYTISDGAGGTGTGQLKVTVLNTPDAPIADAGGPYVVTAGKEVTLDASGTVDVDPGEVLTYAWDPGL